MKGNYGNHGKPWEYLSPSSSHQQHTALASCWHGGSGSSMLPKSGKPEQVLHPHGAAAVLCVLCPGYTPPPGLGNDTKQLRWWVSHTALFKTEVLLVLSLGKHVCPTVPHITPCGIVGILLPKESPFLSCLSDLGMGS